MVDQILVMNPTPSRIVLIRRLNSCPQVTQSVPKTNASTSHRLRLALQTLYREHARVQTVQRGTDSPCLPSGGRLDHGGVLDQLAGLALAAAVRALAAEGCRIQ